MPTHDAATIVTTTTPARSRLREYGIDAWSAIGIALVSGMVLYLIWTIRLIALPVFVAVLVAAATEPVVRWLDRRGVSRGLAAFGVLTAAVGIIVVLGTVAVPILADQFGEVRTTVGDAIDRLERWVDRERPFGLAGSDVADLRERATDADATATALGVTPADGLRLVGGAVSGVLLGLVTTFFLLRDAPDARRSLAAHVPPERADQVDAAVVGAVRSLRAYLAGAATLGAVEGAIIALTLWVVGAEMAVVVGVLTLVGAFVPFVGAIVTGLVAVGVALVTAGPTAAIVVAVVAVTVQQLDNELLAPLIYGRFLKIHPLTVILATAVGIELAGIIGAFVTVPLTAAVTGARRQWAAAGSDEPFPTPAAG